MFYIFSIPVAVTADFMVSKIMPIAASLFDQFGSIRDTIKSTVAATMIYKMKKKTFIESRIHELFFRSPCNSVKSPFKNIWSVMQVFLFLYPVLNNKERWSVGAKHFFFSFAQQYR